MLVGDWKVTIMPGWEPSYSSTQHTVCAGCAEDKHTPLRRDEMGGYVCLKCVDKRLDAVCDREREEVACKEKVDQKGIDVGFDNGKIRPFTYDSYSVPGSCTNCGHRGFISASKGTTIEGKYQCARCGCRTMEKCWRRERE
jgi:hypothetical protein